MPLEAEGNLRLALSTEENNFVENLIGTLIRVFLLLGRKSHPISLLQDCGRLDLVH
jgi:hypothetical protein